MKLIAPKFWQERSFLAYLFLPLGWVYGALMYIRRIFSSPQKVKVPVICVGNVTVGGSGKTPAALAIAEILVKSQIYSREEIAFITRGYKGCEEGPLKVELHRHTARETGDEALLLAARQPTFVARNRYKGAQMAVGKGARLVILDDGLQHQTLYQNIRFLVIDGTHGLGNQYVLPAGPLREPITLMRKHVDAVIIAGPDIQNLKSKFESVVPVFQAFIQMNFQLLQSLKKYNLIAFAGIGYPQKFYNFLKSQGLNIIDFLPFPDHHEYSLQDIHLLQNRAEKAGAVLLTTEKDYVKLPDSFKSCVKVCPVSFQFHNADKVCNFIKERLANER